MEEIQHRFIDTNGIKMHYAELGSGPMVLLLHGFPELWYSWRYQITALAGKGFHVVAPDLRGYGQTDAPLGVHKYTTLQIVADIIGLLNALNQQQVLLAGHDCGAAIGWDLCLFRPERVKAYAALSVPYLKPGVSPLQAGRLAHGEDFYMARFQEPGKAEALFAAQDQKAIFKSIFLSDRTEAVIPPEDFQLPDNVKELPSWLTNEDLDYFKESYSRSGFTGPLNYYRAIDMSWELKAAWIDAKIQVPSMYITGMKDLVYHFPGMQDYIHKGGFQADVPQLEDCIVLDSAHFMQQEKHEEVNKLLIHFFNAHRD